MPPRATFVSSTFAAWVHLQNKHRTFLIASELSNGNTCRQNCLHSHSHFMFWPITSFSCHRLPFPGKSLRGNYSAVVGSISERTRATMLAGKPPFSACI